MSPVITDLLPLTIGAALTPLWLIVVLLLLRGPGGPARALLFYCGVTAARLVQGAIFGIVFYAPTSGSDDEAGTLVATLLLLLGIVLWITAVKKWRKEADPDDPPPAWMTRIAAAGPLAAFGFGALLVAVGVKYWVFTLGAIAVIETATNGVGAFAISFLAFVFIAQLPLLLPIIFHIVAPKQAGPLLESIGNWLERNNRMVVVSVAAIFGAYFLYQGITGLMN